MSERDQESKRFNAKLAALVIVITGVVVAAVTLVAMLYTSGNVTVVAKSQGVGSIEFKLDQSKIHFSELLDKLLSEQPGSNVDSTTRRRLIANILRSHQFYYIPSDDAVTALRQLKETDGTRKFMRAVRGLLYDLAGPFQRPYTFAEANDDRLLDALNDLYSRKPPSPLAVRLWEMTLNLHGIFNRPPVSILARVDSSLPPGIAATCAGSPVLEKIGIIQATDEKNQQHMIKVMIQKPRMCEPVKTEDILSGKRVKVWISASDMEKLVLNKQAGYPEIHAELQPEALGLLDEVPAR